VGRVITAIGEVRVIIKYPVSISKNPVKIGKELERISLTFASAALYLPPNIPAAQWQRMLMA
jgi:hypothetical protein